MMEITLTNDDRVALVSDVDYDWLRQHRWRLHDDNASGKPYVRGQIEGKTVYMHRAITKCSPLYKVDHRDSDGLNNQRPNLRIATHNQNNHNRSGWGLSQYKGVYMDRGRWRARIMFEGERIALGGFRNQIEAAKAYDVAAFEKFGEFAYLNFPEDYPQPVYDTPEIPFFNHGAPDKCE